MSKFIDMTGWRMWEHGIPDSRLIVIKQNGRTNAGAVIWECRCSCGSNKKICATPRDIRSGHTKSCGCLRREHFVSMSQTASIKHGGSYSRLYRIWTGMKERCYNKNNLRYNCYGGRGIEVCDGWKNSFQVFENWAINNGYDENLTIDRIDVDLGYYPENCRWITNLEQQNNRRDNIFVLFEGKVNTLSEWARIKNIPYKEIRKLYYKGKFGIRVNKRPDTEYEEEYE